MISLFIASPVFSQSQPQPLKNLQNSVDNFSKKLALSMPFNSTMGLNWSDAYIGQLLDLPPHFGVGLAVGFTTIDSKPAEKLLNQFGLELPMDFGKFPLPGYTVEGRIGGFLLPFDVGLKIGYLNMKPADYETKYFLVGGDVRYAVLKGDVFPLKVSAGLGFNHLRGEIGLAKKGFAQEFNFNNDISSYTMRISDPKVNLSWETSSLDIKAQASFSLAIITPYIGIGASYAWSKAGYKADAKLTDELDVPLIQDKDAVNAIKNYGIDVSSKGLSSIVDVNNFSARLFGGLSFNLAVVKIDLTGMYNFIDSQYGVTFGTRFQL